MDGNRGQLRYASILTLLIAIALLLVARLVYLYVADPLRFPITTIRISANYNHVTHKQLETVLDKYSQDSFFSLPIGHLHQDLSALEWVKSVQIDRVWPDVVKITLVEKKPIANWNTALLSEDGEIFNEGGAPVDIALPQLMGPIKQSKQVLQVYQKMSKILSIHGLHADKLILRDNQAWELTLSNGVLLRLGKGDLETKVNRFCKAYPAVFADKPDLLASVDLRYPHGMAVQWKK